MLNTYAHYINWDTMEPSYHMMVTVGAIRGAVRLRNMGLIKPPDAIFANLSK